MLLYFLLLSDLVIISLATRSHTDDIYLAVKRVTEDVEVTQGPPGKRGAIGTPGPVGPMGPKGEVGECTCDLNELDQLRTHVGALASQLQAFIQEGDRRTASLTEQLNSIPREFPRPEEGWYTPWNGYQYYISSSSQSWQESRRLCQEKGADLAVVGMRNLHTRNIIMHALTEDSVWIGLNDISDEGRFIWLDGVASTSSNTHWLPGEPNNYRGNEDCGHLYFQNSNYRSSDSSCSSRKRALCEKRLG